jgi:hypothetical protein
MRRAAGATRRKRTRGRFRPFHRCAFISAFEIRRPVGDAVKLRSSWLGNPYELN